ncbi:rhythmically expressed gene 2 protein-like [Uloborus diversus]|uniref:rhythmically expressed gene 2 protein-like n=1 Tax=Uloborus diversus TaxID=327109 RepID=UPI00240912F2|nr:rhythmically expressed gene 2 protein-like [Uloborus diversus]
MTSVKNRFKLCTFDVTNTLLKFRQPVGEQYAKVGLMYGVNRKPEKLTRSFMQHWKTMNAKYPNFGQSSGLKSELWWKQLVQQVFATDDEELSSTELDSISSHLFDLYKGGACWTVVPEAKTILKRLRQNGLTLGVISNFDERLDSVLLSTGLKSFFDFILASYIVQVAKPSKDIFNLALNQVPGLKSYAAIHIGDNIELDYLAAKNSGWNALLISDNKNSEEIHKVNPSDIIQDVTEIERHLL